MLCHSAARQARLLVCGGRARFVPAFNGAAAAALCVSRAQAPRARRSLTAASAAAPQQQHQTRASASAGSSMPPPKAPAPAAARARALDMLKFIDAAWTPFHAVEEAARRLAAAGFEHIAERDAWDLKPGGKYYFTRNMSTVVAFAVGEKFAPGGPFYMVGAHTDSPCLKLKPVSKAASAGCQMVNVETYGGGLWHTWFDRDLGIAGRVLVRDHSTGGLKHRLVKVDRPLMRIPMLAIHLQRGLYTDGFKPNFQTHLMPLLATNAKAAALAANNGNGDGGGVAAAAGEGDSGAAASNGDSGDGDSIAARHHAALLAVLADALGVPAADIVDFELNACDVQPGSLSGAAEEFVAVGRLDNLASCYTAIEALCDSVRGESALADETAVRAVACFDHEEVGSDSAQGAGGPVMRDTIKRVAGALGRGEEGAVERSLRASFLVSADMAHALHPNYTDKHDAGHAPAFHGGLVLKHNSNQRYATNAVSAALFREVARRKGIPTQEFSVRNDMPCGSTIGPILASALGCRTVDVGMPQLAMHSIRETCGVDDVSHAYEHFLAFFSEFSALDATLDVDALPPPDIRGTIDDAGCDACAANAAARASSAAAAK